MKRPGATVLLHLVLLVGAVAALAPLAWMVAASLMPTGEANSFPPRFLPSRPTLLHYRELFTRLNIGRTFASSLIVASATTIVSLLFNSMAGYAFAKLRFPGRDRLFRSLLAAMVIPAPIAMLPLFLLLRSLKLVNSYAGVVLPAAATILGVFLIRQFVLTTLGIVTFLATWNDFIWPLIVLTDERRYTLPVALASLVGEHVQDTELMMAGSVLTVMPVLLLFLLLQKQYIEGITLGGLKE